MKTSANPEKSKGLENRQRIVDAANRLFYQRGYNQTSFSDVAAASGVPKGNFYYYFKSKDDLLTAVIEDRMARIRAMLTEWDQQLPDPKARLKRYAMVLLHEADDVTRYGCPMGSLNVELGKTQLQLQSQAARMFAIFRDWLEHQFVALGKDAESGNLALHLLALNQGAALISNAFPSPGFLRTEVERIQGWIESL